MNIENKGRLALIALGANVTLDTVSDITRPMTLGNALNSAVTKIAESGESIKSVSKFYRTPCFPPGAGPDYVNAAISLYTKRTPADLLATLHEVEGHFDRTREVRWGQRTMDLDLLAYEGDIIPDGATFDYWMNLPPETQVIRAPDQLILPHPRMHERAFVLVPLCDVAPDWRHPVLGQSVREMLSSLEKTALEEVKPL